MNQIKNEKKKKKNKPESKKEAENPDGNMTLLREGNPGLSYLKKEQRNSNQCPPTKVTCSLAEAPPVQITLWVTGKSKYQV